MASSSGSSSSCSSSSPTTFVPGFISGSGPILLAYVLDRFTSLGSVARKEMGLIWDVESNIRKLERTFLKIQDFLQVSPLRLFGEGRNGWQILFEDMRKMAYDADNLLDYVSLHLYIYTSTNAVASDQRKMLFQMVVSSFKEINIPHEIGLMQTNLDGLLKEMESLILIEKEVKNSGRGSNFSANNVSSFFDIDETLMVGSMRMEKNRIVDLLGKKCEGASLFSVIPIVGMCGIGKTALARCVYHDANVRSMFRRRIWVSVTMDFDVIRITRSIIEAATLCDCNLSDLNSLQAKLQEILSNDKFLLVLDDYWSENRDDWEVLCSPFRFGSKESKIIVTSRISTISSIVSSTEGHNMTILSDDECWELLKQKLRISQEAIVNLEQVGREIAKKCRGLPLVATTFGSALKDKSSELDWRAILENEVWAMPQCKGIFMDLLKSFIYLPAHLQRCAGYCSIFPKDHVFESDEIVLLWMAEGFIEPVGNMMLEDIGRGYFSDLCSKGIFERTSTGITYKLNTFMHDMLGEVSKDICSRVTSDKLHKNPLFGSACHLSLFHDGAHKLELKALEKNERLRSFIVITDSDNSAGVEIKPDLFSELKYLRVLGLSGIGLNGLTKDIGKLMFLRYMNLSKNPIQKLPGSICKLLALQTLKLRDCPGIKSLPDEMSNLLNLRHFEFDVRNQVKQMPLEFGRLVNLQTLSAYLVGTRKGDGIEELKNLDCLRGSLCIANIDNVWNVADAVNAKLSKKTGLKKLELRWRHLRDGLDQQNLDERRSKQGMVLANLVPPIELKELVIENYNDLSCPNWLSSPLAKFTSISLEGLKFCDNLPSLGQLPYLKSFVIKEMPCLRVIDREFYGGGDSVEFPSLEYFVVLGMSSLIKWTYVSNSAMPCLKKFEISHCPNLISLPSKLELLLPSALIEDCPNLQH